MATIRRIFLACLLASGLLAAWPALATEAPAVPLVSAEWLLRHRESADVLLLDASPPPLYAAQHIPGAVSASVMSYGVQDDSAAVMEQRFQSWGVSPGRKTVIYDQGDPMWAARLFFDLHRHGYPMENLFLLDGGLAKWKEAGGALTKDATPPPPKGTFRVAKVNEEVRARLPEVLAATGDPAGNTLVEALDAGWHFGGTQFFDRPGHIPHGILLPSTDFYNPDKTFKSPAEIRRMLAYLGVRPEQQVITYCGGGIAAAVPYFALKYLLGYPRVKLFVESELGWLRDERGLPFWTHDAPYLMRETAWLKTWGGRMMRMYGISRVSVVDLRPAGDFAFGHIPFAVNIPAEVFRANVATPGKLAEILGRAGVDPTHEAVVVSGKGLDKDSALAFLMLERLGQAKVSVFLDSHEKSVQAGLALADAAEAKKAAGSVRPFEFPAAKFRKDLAIADPRASQGLYPKLFVASGQRVPERAPAGKVVHVPFTELVNADGTPKAAKDIWQLLTKAGVPRYAELVAFSDDPGEAAANYFLLKLMGFPDVKVLLP